MTRDETATRGDPGGSQEDGPCPECGRGVHKDGSHTLSCSRRTATFPWEDDDD